MYVVVVETTRNYSDFTNSHWCPMLGIALDVQLDLLQFFMSKGNYSQPINSVLEFFFTVTN